MPVFNRNQETAIEAALGHAAGRALIVALNAAQLPPGAPPGPPLVNHAAPTYVAAPDYSETVDGTLVTYLTVGAVRTFLEVTMTLAPKHINALREEGITHPIDLAQFTSKEFEMVIRSMKGRQAALPGLAQILLKQACDFFQFCLATERKMKDQYLTRDSIKSHAIQFQAFKDTDSKEIGGLPMLTASTDVLIWLDRVTKHLQKLPGVDNSPLAYLLRENPVALPTTIDLLPDRCYSTAHHSMAGELIARKSQRDTCAESDKVTLYGLLVPALENGPLESALQPHEETRDGRAVMREIATQHGGRVKWERAHDQSMKETKNEWSSANANKTLTLHIASLRQTMVDLKNSCKHTDRSPPSVREQVLWMISSINTSDPLLIAHIAQINGDPAGMGMNFELAATHLMLADPVERATVRSSKRKRNGITVSALSGRGESGVDFRWHNKNEFKALTSDQKDELSAWRNTPPGQKSMKEAREKFKAQMAAKKLKKEEGGGSASSNDKASEKQNNKKLQKKFQVSVVKAAKKMVAESMEAEKAEVAAADQSLDAAIKRRAGAAVISATSVGEDENALENADKKFEAQQAIVKLSSVKARLTKMAKKVTLKVD